MTQVYNFQQVIMKLHEYWTSQGCVLWEPYNVQLGAGTGNPGTTLRVLGPEPWWIAYTEPSVRPDDGRFGENPNRMQKYYQYQVILQPDPGNPQELYLQSLAALGIHAHEHDIRFVEDNWESPALGAWGLGWEVWLNGQEITQFTYFQQSGGMELNPVAVEITYGIERIVLALQGKDSAWDIEWMPQLSYADVMLTEEIEHCMYYFNIADIEGLKEVYDIYEGESKLALSQGAIISAYDYVLKCSHLFNVLDTRGAIGVTERASYFRRMRDMSRDVAKAYVAKREELGYPMMKMSNVWKAPELQAPGTLPPSPTEAADVLLEIGVEELPAADVDAVQEQLEQLASELFTAARLTHDGVDAFATPRRLVVYAQNVAPRQPNEEMIVKGPPANRAFDADGNPTKAAEGFARGKGVSVDDLKVEEIDGGEYVTAFVQSEGRPATEVLSEALPALIANIKFGKAMRWNETDIAFSRPIRWITALFGADVIPFAYAGIASDRVSRGLRPNDSPLIALATASDYLMNMSDRGIILSIAERRQVIQEQVQKLAEEVNGTIPGDPGLLDEVANLIESPTAFRGQFEDQYLALPRDVLVTVMRKHQRYFPVEDENGNLMPYFIAVRNGGREYLDNVITGNEHVLRARFADADFFFKEDRKKPLEQHLSRLSTLTFQEHLGSMLDKNQRIVNLAEVVGKLLGMDATDIAIAQRASHILKADLGTQMVVELTSLQGSMGREYAVLEGFPEDVANAIYEHWLPRSAGDVIPGSDAGVILALTDRLDSLTGLFGVGLAPRSTADPYGLRRAAAGIVQILIGHEIDVNLADLLSIVAAEQPVGISPEVQKQVLDFIRGRLESWLIEETDYARDVISAVLAEQANNPYRAVQGIQQLNQWVQRDDWEVILDNFARCVRITRNEAGTYSISADHLSEPQEKALYNAVGQVREQVNENGRNVDEMLTAFVPIVPVIQDFFDHVLVNTDDEQTRHNRIGMLQAIHELQLGIADFSQLTGF